MNNQIRVTISYIRRSRSWRTLTHQIQLLITLAMIEQACATLTDINLLMICSATAKEVRAPQVFAKHNTLVFYTTLERKTRSTQFQLIYNEDSA